MTDEIDISKVLIEGDTATIMGVKYQRVEEPMTDEQKLTLLLKVLKQYAEKKHFGEVYSFIPEDGFDDGAEFGEILFARTLLEQIGVEFEYPVMEEQ